MSPTVASFEFCAMRLFRQWALYERAYHEAFANTPHQQHGTATHEQLRAALAYFRISRNFKGISEKTPKTKRYKKSAVDLAERVLEELGASQPPSERSVVSAVKTLTESWRSLGIQQNNTSAASKLLWLTFRHPVIIYDRRNRDALAAHRETLGLHIAKTQLADYADYWRAWRLCFDHYQPSIDRAISWLRLAPKHMRPIHADCRGFDDTVSSEWFRKRLLDIFLWEHA